MPRRDETAELPLDAVGVFPEDWECSTLGKACSLVTDGTHDSPKESAAGFPLVTGKCITGGRVNLREAYLISEADLRAVIARSRAEFGDILFANIGNSIGELARVETDAEFSIKNVALFKPSERVESRFLKYYLLSPSVQSFIRNTTFGSAQPFIGLGTLRAFPIPLPDIDEQKFIGKVLGSLDDKIELNRRMNETLEALAQSLFKSWFVDATQSALPKGWRETTLEDAIVIHDSKRIPLSSRERAVRRGKYPYHGAASVMDYVDDFLFDGVYTLIGEDGSVVNDDDTPILQYVWGKFWVNNHAHVLTGKNGVSVEHLLFFLKTVNIRPFVTGAVQPKLNQGNLCRVPFVLPPESVCKEFAGIIEPMFVRIRANIEESRTLAALRDTLLPKLLSGELRVTAAPQRREAFR